MVKTKYVTYDLKTKHLHIRGQYLYPSKRLLLLYQAKEYPLYEVNYTNQQRQAIHTSNAWLQNQGNEV